MSNPFVQYLLNRLKEPSTWASIAVALLTIPQVHQLVAELSPWIIPALAGIGGALPEGQK